MLDFPIDPELRIRADPERVLRRTNEALKFVRRMTLTCTGRLWQYVLRDFEAIRDEWSAIEAVVHLELFLEAEGLLIEENQPQQSPRSGKIDPLPARLSAVLAPYRVDGQAPGSRSRTRRQAPRQ
jgi:hypothetical protein